ncbi:enoyl-CoA hydratase/isomerase family protein [Novosphingobium huizhouense]|uniref:enoyl-CoA hydratase/isomerase family protein n=1 Tax=Novosphingobium huizhouense TaxID=2866625 RepID=UPI001CD84698|nr:enoyl-CoA hydratase/isomerase family protein [Novosphingobium huizhouense]
MAETPSPVSTRRHGRVLEIVLTNPPRGYMNARMAADLLATVRSAQADDSIGALLVTGGLEGVFVRHYDVGEIAAVSAALAEGRIGPEAFEKGSDVLDLVKAMIDSPIPTVAAINGMCMGGGCEFALSFDMRVAQTGDYRIGLPETRLGIIPGVGGQYLLARLIGVVRATAAVMRGAVFTPEEAHRLGVVDEVVADARARGLELAQDYAARPRIGIDATRRLARMIEAGAPQQDVLDRTAREFAGTLIDSPETDRLIARFLGQGEDILAD